jgi:hypothetical protein
MGSDRSPYDTFVQMAGSTMVLAEAEYKRRDMSQSAQYSEYSELTRCEANGSKAANAIRAGIYRSLAVYVGEGISLPGRS